MSTAIIGFMIIIYWNGLTVLNSRDKVVAESEVIRTTVFALAGLINLLFLGWSYHVIALEIRRYRATQSESERQREEAIHQKETLRVTLASIGDCVIVTDIEGRITFMNAAAEALTGWMLAEARSVPVAQVFKIINEFTREPVASPVDKALEGGVNASMAKHTMLIRKDGSQVPIDDSSAPIRNVGADILGVVLVFRDFTGYKNAESELNGAKEVAEAASRTKDHFLAMLSHELRTPLTPVLATLNMWGLTGEVPPALEADVELIRRNVEMECRLIDDLLDLTRISKGKLSLQPEVTNVHHLIKLVVGMCEEQIRTNRLDVCQELNAMRPYVYADSARLQQVVWNIVKNATKFTGQGGRISIVTDNDHNGNIRIVFTDSGIGMSKETMSRLFRPFEQGERDEVRRSGGLGLGMSISRALLELMGGSISAASNGVGKGSSFTVTVPSVEAPQNEKPVQAGAARETNCGKKLKILLVEDHLDTALAMKRLLELRGHELHLAHSVAAAVEMIDNEKFELLLCDLGLPDGTGFDVIRHYRRLYQTPAIAVSGFGMESDVSSCLEAGFDAHITKPINFQEMEATIRKLTDPDPSELQVSR
jgi:PAS domain S-box-containing protein